MMEMVVHGVNMDLMANQPVIILKDAGSRRFLPIWIGQFEATSILMEIQGVKPSRPLTHDLLTSIIGKLKATVQRIVINDLKDGTFFAKIHLTRNGTKLIIDSRPSDAIALAVRVKVPIFADEKVVDKASIVSQEGEEEEVERFREFLKNVEPDDFDSTS